MKHVMCVHTAMALVEPLTKLFQELMPEVTVNHIADSSLIKEVIAHNEVTLGATLSLASHVFSAHLSLAAFFPAILLKSILTGELFSLLS